jgi:hypothetical protein
LKNQIIALLNILAFFILPISTVSASFTIDLISQKSAPFSSTITPLPSRDSSRGAVELKYYIEENINQVVCCDTGGHSWKTAIRLTPDEMAPYWNWTFTKVNVVTLLDGYYPNGVDIRIFIYDKGTTPIHPGPLITNDTVFHINTSGITTIPLVNPINLTCYEEIWVAVEWPSLENHSSFAWMDTLSGPHVENKSDFFDTGSWYQVHNFLPTCDGRWGIGAIVEGPGAAELLIGNVTGCLGIHVNVSNIGEFNARNVSWSIAITGGIWHQVNINETGSISSLGASSSFDIGVGMFFGFGFIKIVITVAADNAFQVSAIKTAFLLGPFVHRIR